MRGAYSRYPANLWTIMQFNAGTLVDDFDPATGEIGAILGATRNGAAFNPNPQYEDMGAAIDNIPNNSSGMMVLRGYAPTLSGTFVSMTPALSG